MINDEAFLSKDLKMVFRFIGDDDKENINVFYDGCLSRQYKEFDDLEMALMSTDFSDSYNRKDKEVFSNYSGFNYRRINACARGTWNYEKHGHIDEKMRYDQMTEDLKMAIETNQKSIGNVKVFRGVPLSYFSEYGISTLEELENLNGGFLLDKGFVSTSLVDEACYYKKDNELGLDYNVKIEYLVPEEFGDGVSISNLSYSPGQCEYLINAWNLAKVVDVKMDQNDGAIVSAMLVPKYVYDKGYRQTKGEVK